MILDLNVSALANNCALIGHCSKADCVWTRDDFLTICELLRNGNAPTEFLLVYRDNENRPQFAKSKTAKARKIARPVAGPNRYAHSIASRGKTHAVVW